MKKIFWIIAFVFLLTGCTAQYNLIINEDLSIVEEAKLSGTNEFYSNYYKSTKKNVLQTILDRYTELLEQNGYEYKLVADNNPYVYLKKKYDTIDDYTKNTILLNDYFDKINYTESDSIIKIETEGFHENNPEDPNRFDIKELSISIKCPYKVVNHNAKSFNKKTNTYYYDLSKENKIILEYDKNKKFNANEDLYYSLLILLGIVVVSWLTVLMINKKNK